MRTMPTSTAGMNGHHHRHPPALAMSSPDSAIGTASTGPHSHNGGAPSTKVSNAKSVRDDGIISGKLDPEQIVCRRDYQRTVKETELFIGTPCTSRAQLLADSRLLRDFDETAQTKRGRMRDTESERGKRNARYEYGKRNAEHGGAKQSMRNAEAERVLPVDELLDEQCRRYYLYDTARHEYRLYYSREVRLRSASNLAEFGEDEPYQRTQSSGTLHADAQRAHGASSKSASVEGLLQHQFQPKKSAGTRTAMTTTFPAAELKTDMQQDDLQYGMRQEPRTPRMGAFERNSVTRKPLHTRVASDPPRRRQWSGGARRAAEQKLHERNLQGLTPRKPEAPVSAVRFTAPEVERTAGAPATGATTALLRDLLRPLRNTVPTEEGPTIPTGRTRTRTWDMTDAPPVARSGKTAEMHQLLVAADYTKKADKPDAWSMWKELCCCWWRPTDADVSVKRRTLPERITAPLSPRMMRRLIGCVLCPLVIVLIGAVVVVVLLIYYA